MVMPDTPTIFLVGVVICGLTAAAQWALAERLHRDALRLWAGANLLFGLGGIVYMVRPSVPVAVVDFLGNGPFFVGLGLIGAGVDRFDGRRPRFRGAMLVTAAALSAIGLVRAIDRSREDLAIFLVALAVAVLAVRVALSLLAPANRRSRAIRGLSATAMLVFACCYLGRGVAVLAGWLDPHEAAFGMLGGVVRLTALAMVTGWTVGSFVLAFDRVASTDELTGLLNRRAVLEAGSLGVRDAAVSGRPLSVLMVDLDHFKRVNDDFGHLAGDVVLQAFADTARLTLPDDGGIGRLGGEEFCVVLAATDATAATEIAERLRAACAATLGPRLTGTTRVTVSVGVATLGGGAVSFGDLVERADAALYRAKARGRDRVIHADGLAEAA